MVGTLVDATVVILPYFALTSMFGRPLNEGNLLMVLAVTLLSFPGSLPFRRFSGEVTAQLVTRWAMLLLLLVAFAMIVGSHTDQRAAYHRFFAVAWGLLSLAALLITHWLSPGALRLLDRMRKRRAVVIVGVNDVALQLGKAIVGGEVQGQKLGGYFDDRSAQRTSLPGRYQHLGGMLDVGEFVRRHDVACIYITLPVSSAPRMLELLRQAKDTTASVYFVPNISLIDAIQCRVAQLGGVPMVAVCETPLNGGYGALKRTLDVSLTLAAMPLLLPLMALIAVLIRATSKGPSIFKQRRFGLDGQEIIVWKFRTMTTLEDGCSNYTQACPGDTRVTPLGRILRRTSLDELPQFLNVLGGSMSIVGPRPHAMAVNEHYRKEIPGYMLRHKVKPGITGWAQVNGHRGGDDIDAMRKRTECDIEYLKSWSIGLDILIIWKTAVLLVAGDRHAY
ncbi:MAG: undecaprenyl-phosphate glucose phosphotransferase [Frankiales bacterium]|nr:undecaprenyl-phosphate glucose phosphotransferase [Frankiales bacterium]